MTGQHTGSLTKPGWCLQRPPRLPSSRYSQLSIRRFPSCKAPILRGQCPSMWGTNTKRHHRSGWTRPSTSPNSRARRRGGGSHPQTRPARVAGLFPPSRFAKPPVSGPWLDWRKVSGHSTPGPHAAQSWRMRALIGRGRGKRRATRTFRVMVEPVLLSLSLSRIHQGGISRRHLRGHWCDDPRGGARREWWRDEESEAC